MRWQGKIDFLLRWIIVLVCLGFLTCVLVSGLAHFNSPDLLSWAILAFSWCDKTTVKGIHSSVSSVAYPNINPWGQRTLTSDLQYVTNSTGIYSNQDIFCLNSIFFLIVLLSSTTYNLQNGIWIVQIASWNVSTRQCVCYHVVFSVDTFPLRFYFKACFMRVKFLFMDKNIS